MKYLLVALVLWIAWSLLKRSRSSDKGTALWHPRSGTPSTPARGPVPLKACAHCGVMAQEDALLQAGAKWYCSTAHQQAAARGEPPPRA